MWLPIVMLFLIIVGGPLICIWMEPSESNDPDVWR